VGAVAPSYPYLGAAPPDPCPSPSPVALPSVALLPVGEVVAAIPTVGAALGGIPHTPFAMSSFR